MDESNDFDQWLKKLECPESYVSNQTKTKLQRGVLGILWEDLSKSLRPAQEVEEIRKNIILYKFKNEPNDVSIQSVQNARILRDERQKLNNKIKALEDRWRNKEFSCRQKISTLQKKKEEKYLLETKRDILKLKHEQTLREMENCSKMQEICQNLMPPNEKKVQENIIVDCLELASNVPDSSDRKKAWNKISELLKPIKVPILWNALLTARSQCTDHLIQLDLDANQNANDAVKSNIHGHIARLCSEHINNLGNCIVHGTRVKSYEAKTMEYVDKIEELIESQGLDFGHWLPLTLEVKKLEILQVELQKEFERIESQSLINFAVDEGLKNLISEIKFADEKIADYVQDIQNAFGLLKSSNSLIYRKTESLEFELEKINLMRDQDDRWTSIDLSTELLTFSDSTKLEALRKIMLKGEKGSYKHLQTCFRKSAIVVDASMSHENFSNFPMLRTPIYYLVDFLKTFVAHSCTFSKLLNDDTVEMDDFEYPTESLQTAMHRPMNSSYHRVLELRRIFDSTCSKTSANIKDFEQIFKIWSTQSTQDIVKKIFIDKLVHGATFEEWQNRFSRFIYILHKSNINVV